MKLFSYGLILFAILQACDFSWSPPTETGNYYLVEDERLTREPRKGYSVSFKATWIPEGWESRPEECEVWLEWQRHPGRGLIRSIGHQTITVDGDGAYQVTFSKARRPPTGANAECPVPGL
jgi:hypothetical protein